MLNKYFFWIANFLGIQALSSQSQCIVIKFFVFSLVIQSATLLSSTFLLLYVLQFVTYLELGMLVSVAFITQSLLEYPSGNIGDFIGQKWVLFVAMIVFGVSFLIVHLSNSLFSFSVAYFLIAVGKSQESGALQSWFENNYKFTSGITDLNRIIYKVFLGKQRLWLQVIGGCSIITGGLLATLFSRGLVFLLQMTLYFLLAISLLLVLNDANNIPKSHKRDSFTSTFRKGIIFLLYNRILLLYMIGSIIFGVAWSIWGELVLIPMYFGYTGSDYLASVFRTSAWFLGIFLMQTASKLSIKLEKKTKIPLLRLLHGLLVFGSFFIIFIVFPLPNGNFNIIVVVLYLVISFVYPLLDSTADFLEKDFYLDSIPDELRNSYYSLNATLTSITSVPGFLLGSFLISEYGYPSLMLFLIFLIILSMIIQFLGVKQWH